MLISVIIVNWNTRDLLLSCIRSIEAACDSSAAEIVVVDNASSDGSADAVAEHFPSVKLIRSEKNLGFAGGNNLGAREAAGRFLLLLNPDTVVEQGVVEALVQIMGEHDDIGLIGPRLVGADGEDQISSFGLFPSVSEAFVHAAHLWTLLPGSSLSKRFLAVPQEGDWCYAAHLLGACILIRREVWDELDGMDEGFFLFLEETDLCHRALLNGWRCAYTTRVSIVHYGEQSVKHVLESSGGLYIRSYNRFCRKSGMGSLKRLSINAILIAGVVASAAVVLARTRSCSQSVRALGALKYGYFRQPVVGRR